jgi:acetate kinase
MDRAVTAPILCVNSGSSSIKVAMFEGEGRVLSGAVEGIGGNGDARVWFSHRDEGIWVDRPARVPDHEQGLELAFALLDEKAIGSPGLVGHRIVHGGPRTSPALVDDTVMADLRSAIPMAPLHLPAALEGIETVRRRDPGVPQVVCFDTGFHATLPELTRRLPIPETLAARGVHRYGFHGLSYEYVMSALDHPPARIVIAHLGSGASLVAVRDGRSVDTTMSFSPASGIPMGTRAGDLDPGILVYLAREDGLDVEEIERLVNQQSGLLGVGGSADLRDLLERRHGDPRADLAVRMFAYAVKKAIGAFVAALGGLDLLVFTGGVGERAAAVRAEACQGLEAMGISLDAARNAANEEVIQASDSRCVVRVIATDEERMIARHCRRVVAV